MRYRMFEDGCVKESVDDFFFLNEFDLKLNIFSAESWYVSFTGHNFQILSEIWEFFLIVWL